MMTSTATQALCGEHGQPLSVTNNGFVSSITCPSGCALTWADVQDSPGEYVYAKDGRLMVEDVTDEAMESGRQRGYDHANYVSAYGGNVRYVPTDDEIPMRFYNARTWFRAGWEQGIEDYNDEQQES